MGAINNKVYEKIIEISGKDNYWFGINDVQTEGTWVYSSDSSSIPYTQPWYTASNTSQTDVWPIYSGDCGYFRANSDSSYYGKWWDANCGSAGYFICEF